MGDSFTVTLDSYCLDETEVTVADYARCVSVGACSAPAVASNPPRRAEFDGHCNTDKFEKQVHPINCVRWQDATDYCRYLLKRLPTEAEWEYAARGGENELAYPWGDVTPTDDASACWDPSSKRKGTCAVASHPAAAFQLRDMAGNVSEWVADWFGEYPSEPARNYHGPASGTLRVVRGGGWSVGDPMLMHGVIRSERAPDYVAPTTGFRCARSHSRT